MTVNALFNAVVGIATAGVVDGSTPTTEVVGGSATTTIVGEGITSSTNKARNTVNPKK